MTTTRFNLTIQSEHDPLGRSPEYRLKLVLKSLLRSLHFRCIEVSECEAAQAREHNRTHQKETA